MKFRSKKSLGQHFLLNPTTIDSILRKARLSAEDQILEIGPGPGLMTKKIAERAKRLIAVEKDHYYAESLKEKLKRLPHVTVVRSDFLSLNLEKLLESGEWKVIANLPYNIATEAIFHLLEVSSFFSSFYLMVQKEVALRLAAVPGSKNYGILSIFSQLISKNRVVMKLPPGAFTPPPKVDSAIVEFLIQEIPPYDIHHLPTFEAVVQAAFNQRRKMLRNALLAKFSPIEVDAALEKAGILPTRRAEEIAIGGFVRLANEIQGANSLR
ncbi:MAG: ribosomal RNA small subunit methyltransferase A [Deltaproteobacteria bacterium]|nr:ribosomal RNA small subunit methyltransferase A [Deltaproteobacteria bacterium]MBI4373372.1 ribosomal RNA small subunit methyltransferase A [Deltaproteobacteria bacterium]